MVLSATLPVKPSVDDHVHDAVHDVAALDVAVEVHVRVGGDEPVGLDHVRRALGGLLADGEQADGGVGDAHHLAREDGPHHGELVQVIGLVLGVGADVQEGDGPRHARHDGADGRPLRRRLMRRTYRRAPAVTAPGVAGAHEGVGLAGVHQLEADDDARLGAVARRPGRLLVVADDVGGVHDGDVLACRPGRAAARRPRPRRAPRGAPGRRPAGRRGRRRPAPCRRPSRRPRRAPRDRRRTPSRRP